MYIPIQKGSPGASTSERPSPTCIQDPRPSQPSQPDPGPVDGHWGGALRRQRRGEKRLIPRPSLPSLSPQLLQITRATRQFPLLKLRSCATTDIITSLAPTACSHCHLFLFFTHSLSSSSLSSLAIILRTYGFAFGRGEHTYATLKYTRSPCCACPRKKKGRWLLSVSRYTCVE